MGDMASNEACTAQFVTAGGVRYAIWASTDASNDLACNIRIEPIGFERVPASANVVDPKSEGGIVQQSDGPRT